MLRPSPARRSVPFRYRPAEHAAHSASNESFTTASRPNVLAGHTKQIRAPALSLYWPIVQESHAAAFTVSLKRPASHDTHSLLLARRSPGKHIGVGAGVGLGVGLAVGDGVGVAVGDGVGRAMHCVWPMYPLVKCVAGHGLHRG